MYSFHATLWHPVYKERKTSHNIVQTLLAAPGVDTTPLHLAFDTTLDAVCELRKTKRVYSKDLRRGNAQLQL